MTSRGRERIAETRAFARWFTVGSIATGVLLMHALLVNAAATPGHGSVFTLYSSSLVLIASAAIAGVFALLARLSEAVRALPEGPAPSNVVLGRPSLRAATAVALRRMVVNSAILFLAFVGQETVERLASGTPAHAHTVFGAAGPLAALAMALVLGLLLALLSTLGLRRVRELVLRIVLALRVRTVRPFAHLSRLELRPGRTPRDRFGLSAWSRPPPVSA